MSFKIDTKEQYTLIRPESTVLNSFLAAQLAATCEELCTNGSKNFILDLKDCKIVEENFLESYCDIFVQYIEEGKSLVIAYIPEMLIAQLKKEDAIDSINYAPTLIEAEDIVKMEILEREIFGE